MTKMSPYIAVNCKYVQHIRELRCVYGIIADYIRAANQPFINAKTKCIILKNIN